MSDLDDLDDQLGIRDPVKDAVVASAHTITLLPGELLAARRARIVPKGFDTRQNALHIPPRDAPQILGDGWLEAQFKGCHRP